MKKCAGETVSKQNAEFESQMPVLTREQVRRVDQIAIEEFGIPGILLMENAGRGCFEQLIKRGCSGPVVICCGPGNNGGDGFVIARHLDNRGIEVKVVLAGEQAKYSGDARTNLNIVGKMGLPIVSLTRLSPTDWHSELRCVRANPVEWLVDALLGTGATGPLRSPMNEIVREINSIATRVMAIDLPTGMDCDTGEDREPTICAEVTCTFVALKPALVGSSSTSLFGQVEVIDIGVPQQVVQQAAREPT